MAEIPTDAQMDRYMTPAMDRIVEKHPDLIDPETGALEDSELVDGLVCSMVKWMVEQEKDG